MYKENAPKFLVETKPFFAFPLPVMLVVHMAEVLSTGQKKY